MNRRQKIQAKDHRAANANATHKAQRKREIGVRLDVSLLISRYFAAAVERLRMDGVLRYH